ISWYYFLEGERGPVTAAELKTLAGHGLIDRETPVRREQDTKWSKAGTVKGLFDASPSRGAVLSTVTEIAGASAIGRGSRDEGFTPVSTAHSPPEDGLMEHYSEEALDHSAMLIPQLPSKQYRALE